MISLVLSICKTLTGQVGSTVVLKVIKCSSVHVPWTASGFADLGDELADPVQEQQLSWHSSGETVRVTFKIISKIIALRLGLGEVRWRRSPSPSCCCLQQSDMSLRMPQKGRKQKGIEVTKILVV